MLVLLKIEDHIDTYESQFDLVIVFFLNLLVQFLKTIDWTIITEHSFQSTCKLI